MPQSRLTSPRAFACAALLGVLVTLGIAGAGIVQPPQYRGFHPVNAAEHTRWARSYVRLEWPVGWWRPVVVEVSVRAPEGAPESGLLAVFAEDGHRLAEVRVGPGEATVVPLRIRSNAWMRGLNLQIRSETVGAAADPAARGVGVDGVRVRPCGISGAATGLLLLGASAGLAIVASCRWPWVGVALPAAVFGLISFGARTVVDDAFINFRIIDNLFGGHGPVFNIGERVEATTSVAWVALLAAARYVLGGHGPVTEWLGVWLGVALGALAVGLAMWSSRAMWRHAVGAADGVPLVPAGVSVVLALSPFREFAASGLETGLVMFWLSAVAAAAVALELDRIRGTWRPAVGMLIGLGPLIRPDLGLMAIVFLVHLCWGRSWKNARVIVAAAAALPVCVEILRAGYYGALVPNTAIAKESFSSRWDQGWLYLVDLNAPYRLVIPLGALALAAALNGLLTGSRPRDRVWTAIVAAAGVHALYIVRLGGDFMHARMLLPALFLVLIPVMFLPLVVQARRSRLAATAASSLLIVVVLWGTWCAVWGEPTFGGAVERSGIAWEARYYRALSGKARPVTLDDYASTDFAGTGRIYRALAEHGPAVVKLQSGDLTLRRSLPYRLSVQAGAIGIHAYAAGPAVHVADLLGRADAVAARLRLARRGRPGHEKLLSADWVAARFADPTALGDTEARFPERAAAATALACRPLTTLVDATTRPMTAKRFVENIRASWYLTMLRIDPVPSRAVKELCGGG